MTKTPEMLLFRPRRLFWDVECEQAAGLIFEELHMGAPKTPTLCFSLSELYKHGHCSCFPRYSVPVNFYKAAYWLLTAATLGNTTYFLFLHRMVPEYFIDSLQHNELIRITEAALAEQMRIAKPGENEEEREAREIFENFIADMLIYPEGEGFNLESALAQALACLEMINQRKTMEAHQTHHSSMD